MANGTLTEVVKVRISAAQLEAVKQYAKEDDRSVGAVIRRALREFLEQREAA